MCVNVHVYTREDPRRRARQPTPYSCLENPMDRGAWWAVSSWGCKESDMTERLNNNTHTHRFSLFTVILFYKATETPNDANSELVVLEETQAWVSQSLGSHVPLLISTQLCEPLNT